MQLTPEGSPLPVFSLFLLLLTKAGRTGETTHLLGRKEKKLFQKLKNKNTLLTHNTMCCIV